MLWYNSSFIVHGNEDLRWLGPREKNYSRKNVCTADCFCAGNLLSAEKIRRARYAKTRRERLSSCELVYDEYVQRLM